MSFYPVDDAYFMSIQTPGPFDEDDYDDDYEGPSEPDEYDEEYFDENYS